ncbi:hypothetical protein CNMCM8980_000882 [Aspergillus fumigatiaffinis]|nr:hypothetical protein CNMCM8980_000882 [Aspergillus fumigatiaffinis]
MHILQLPLEILYQIVEKLDHEELWRLHNCSVALQAVSAPYLFRTVEIRFNRDLPEFVNSRPISPRLREALSRWSFHVQDMLSSGCGKSPTTTSAYCLPVVTGHSRALESMRLRHLSLGDSPLEALSLSRACLEVLERGDSLSWYFGAPFRVNIIQKAVNALFENPHPQLCGTAAGPGRALEWDGIVREFDPRRFEYHGGAVYRGHLRGQLVQLSENDWNMMQSGVPQMLLSHWPPMRHIHAELETLAYSITELRKWNQEALEAIEQNKLLLHTLARRIGWLHDHSQQSSSSAQVRPASPDAESHIAPLATNKSATVPADMYVTERAGEVSLEASAPYYDAIGSNGSAVMT